MTEIWSSEKPSVQIVLRSLVQFTFRFVVLIHVTQMPQIPSTIEEAALILEAAPKPHQPTIKTHLDMSLKPVTKVSE